MDKNKIIETLEKAKESSKKRNFKQSYDLIINLKNIDFKKGGQEVNTFVTLPHELGKKVKVCALLGKESEQAAKGFVDRVIVADDFKKLKKSEVKKIAGEFNYFIAQANLMPQIATVFGAVLGPRGKMPNPKIGCIVPPHANLEGLNKNLQKTLTIANKKSPILQCSIGTEDLENDKLVDNFNAVLTTVTPLLPNDKNSIKNINIKMSMGKIVRLEEKTKKK